MMNAPEIEVLLATYNGAEFVRAQIDSIFAQQGVAFRVLARDDGSSDATVEILRAYAGRDPERFVLVEDGQPAGGAKENFLRLLAASTASYVCFADQDDVWLPDKLRDSLALLKQLEARHGAAAPAMVFSDLVIVDRELRTIHPSFWEHDRYDPRHVYRLHRLMAENVVTGCTMMLNRPLVELSLSMPADAHMHDRWIALLACALGHAEFLPRPTVLYRQHGGNVMGASTVQVPWWQVLRWPHRPEKRVRAFRISVGVASALLRLHGERLAAKDRALLEGFVRSGEHPNRFVRVWQLLRHRLLRTGVRKKLATLWDVWNLKVGRL